MSYRGPYERHLAKQGITLKPERKSFWSRPTILIILSGLLFAMLGIVEALLVGYLPWGRIGHPGLWKLPVLLFLIGLLATFCIFAAEENWFGKRRKLVQAMVGLGIGLGITLLFVHSLTAMILGASAGGVSGYLGEYWGEYL